MGINQFSDQQLSDILIQSDEEPKLKQERPHAPGTIRYIGNREDAAIEGYDLNNYKWLDSTALCTSKDWV